MNLKSQAILSIFDNNIRLKATIHRSQPLDVLLTSRFRMFFTEQYGIDRSVDTLSRRQRPQYLRTIREIDERIASVEGVFVSIIEEIKGNHSF